MAYLVSRYKHIYVLLPSSMFLSLKCATVSIPLHSPLHLHRKNVLK